MDMTTLLFLPSTHFPPITSSALHKEFADLNHVIAGGPVIGRSLDLPAQTDPHNLIAEIVKIGVNDHAVRGLLSSLNANGTIATYCKDASFLVPSPPNIMYDPVPTIAHSFLASTAGPSTLFSLTGTDPRALE